MYFHFLININYQLFIITYQMNGDNNGHDEEAFTDVKLEVPSSSPNQENISHQQFGDRGERVKGEIAMLSSPMQHPHSQPVHSDTSEKSHRPEDYNIKSFVPKPPLSIPTPSR